MKANFFAAAFSIVLMTVIMGIGCSTNSSKQSNPAPAVDAATACQTNGYGTWNQAYSSCTCLTGYALDPTSLQCVANGNASGDPATQCSSSGGSWMSTYCQCPTNMVLSGNMCTASGASGDPATQCSSSGGSWMSTYCQCPTNMVLSGYMCTASGGTTAAGVTQLQCQAASASGAVWNPNYNTCSCPVGSSWNGSTCSLASSVSGLASQLCTASGGVPGAVQGQCTCLSGTPVLSAQGYQYCSLTNSSGSITSSILSNPALLAEILQLLQSIL